MKFCFVESSTRPKGRRPPSAWRIWIVFGLLPALTVACFGQAPTPKSFPNVRKVRRPPLSHIYMHFLLYQNHLDKAAKAREAEGKDGKWLRDHFQKKLDLTSTEFDIVRKTGLQLDSDLTAVRAKALPIIQANRTARLSTPSDPNVPRVRSPELMELQKEQEEAIQRAITRLNQRLGPTDAAKLQQFLENDFIRKSPVAHPNMGPRLKTHMPQHSGSGMVQP